MDRQTETLLLSTALQLRCPDWRGRLLLGLGLNDHGRSVAFASLVTGAATLFLEPELSLLKEAGREGCISFTVTTLDEALRILKNEIRQRHSISVGLSGDPSVWLREMVERGVSPSAMCSTRMGCDDERQSLAKLHAWGTTPFHADGLVPLANDSQDMDAQIARQMQTWQLVRDVASSMTERRTRDEELLGAHPSMEPWLRAAPTLFPRSLQRAYWRPCDEVR